MKSRDKNAKTIRVCVRVPNALWHELDDKRHSLSEDWQSIGMRLWQEWLRSTSDPAENFYSRHHFEHEMLDYILDHGTKGNRIGITENLEAFISRIQLYSQESPEAQRQIKQQFQRMLKKQKPNNNEQTG